MTDTTSSRPPCGPAEIRIVAGELAHLPPYSDDVWTGRYVPRGVLVPFRGQIGTPAPSALDRESLVIRDGGRVLREGVDYVVDAVYGTICLPTADATPLPVSIDYRYSLLRIDSIVREASGERVLLRGVSHLTNPHPPRPAAGVVVEENLLVAAFSEGAATVYAPRSPQRPLPDVQAGILPRAARILSEGEPLRLLFLGDSITEGGDASTEESTFRAIAGCRVRDEHPWVQVSYAATGGSRSVQWLDDSDGSCDWNRVTEAAPQVTVVEFLNDAYLDPAEWEPAYDELLSRLRDAGSEVVLLTPTFALRAAMNGSEQVDDGRPYVGFLRDYAARSGIPLIDVSARWERLRDEGLPYWTLLANGINHPDDRGHRLTGEFIADALLTMLSPAVDA
ncbi:SGNH/GDSL hydrolase family protein [Microbacterium saperdae]|uniref:GDSL-like lipase/acylhydrolase family protein n=1 Tax=Microbacterium saperdae TaxID=69368 RepID=A0A543BBT2_9MICO|nr:SGNH/GDSL hydrolase family protein [Microbacterium saperdae]TQL82287.1 GDSL-like lipase/acylhydrolase family protein [Microbacterium saperdae]GGM38587.1 hypothetical protein GCM10010489_07050 [Microbacterium saperdae]